MLRLLIGIAAGYVLGTKAGRARYEQITRTTKAIVESPATKKAIDVGRRKLADSLDPTPKLEPLKPIDENTQLYVPRDRL
ncbi:hypothetical protein [Rhodococcus gannanensis]|jgi:hypothetical protein|uniref:YtxH domain-containing protein n=1 Tax=Rhodococcus gannanensis TaxID=1960308 RepID=A0ABW4P586_9NOCA